MSRYSILYMKVLRILWSALGNSLPWHRGLRSWPVTFSGGSRWCKTWCLSSKIWLKKEVSCLIINSSSVGKSGGRKQSFLHLCISACSLCLISAPAKPHQEDEAYMILEITVARVTWASSKPSSPWALKVRSANRWLDDCPRTLEKWGVKSSLSVKETPSTFSISTLGIPDRGGGIIGSFADSLGLLMIISLHLDGLRFRLLLEAQTTRLSISSIIRVDMDAGTNK